MSYAEGWIAQAATEPWTDSTFPLEFGEPHADFLYDPTLTNDLFLTIASQSIGDSRPTIGSPSRWRAARDAPRPRRSRWTAPPGLIGTDECDVAVITTAGRGYWIQFYSSGDDPLAVAPYDRAWFEEVLATEQLHPEDAVD